MPIGGINFDAYQWTQLTLSPVAVSANTTAEQTFPVTGLRPTDQVVQVIKPTSQTGLSVGEERVTSAGLLAITFVNTTATPITPTAKEAYNCLFCRPQNVLGGPDGQSGGVIFN